jgi:hypothetical protein
MNCCLIISTKKQRSKEANKLIIEGHELRFFSDQVHILQQSNKYVSFLFTF